MADSVRIELRFGQQVAVEALKIPGNPHFAIKVATLAYVSDPFTLTEILFRQGEEPRESLRERRSH